MPTRKQRRRRQKELRHEYEYVYVDAEGHEVEVEPDEVDRPQARSNGKRDAKPKTPAKQGSGAKARSARKVDPPSWQRVAKRAAIFGPLIFIAFSVINTKQPILERLGVAALYTAFFIPFMYLLDRAMYRSYLRRTGQQASPRGTRRS
jgi:hypothetical protein